MSIFKTRIDDRSKPLNRNLTKHEVGRGRRPYQKLPPEDHMYGIHYLPDQYNAQSLTSDWLYNDPRSKRDLKSLDFKKINKLNVKLDIVIDKTNESIKNDSRLQIRPVGYISSLVRKNS